MVNFLNNTFHKDRLYPLREINNFNSKEFHLPYSQNHLAYIKGKIPDILHHLILKTYFDSPQINLQSKYLYHLHIDNKILLRL